MVAHVYYLTSFEVFQNQKTLFREVYGYQEMLQKAPWQTSTKTYLKGYYNFKYTLSAEVVFKVKVIAVDTEENV
jgi:hypothetical protein